MRKLGFTLAEVLITLVIIGVIAAMTVPTLMNNTQGQENKTAFKKAIASLNQALTLQYALEGETAASKEISEIFQARANVLGAVDWPAAGGGTGAGAGGKNLATADGIIYSFPETITADGCPGEVDPSGEDASIYKEINCGIGYVDVNGKKGPNKFVTNSKTPEDQFKFMIFETKVIPGDAADSVEAAVMYDDKTVGGSGGSGSGS